MGWRKKPIKLQFKTILNTESDAPKEPKNEAKWDGDTNPHNYSFNQFLTRTILMLSKCYESTEIDRRTWLHVRSGLSGPPAVVEIQKETST